MNFFGLAWLSHFRYIDRGSAEVQAVVQHNSTIYGTFTGVILRSTFLLLTTSTYVTVILSYDLILSCVSFTFVAKTLFRLYLLDTYRLGINLSRCLYLHHSILSLISVIHCPHLCTKTRHASLVTSSKSQVFAFVTICHVPNLGVKPYTSTSYSLIQRCYNIPDMPDI